MQLTPSASVVVPLYQDAETIGPCLRSLLDQAGAERLDVIVVDDGSRDGGDAIAEGFPVRVVRQANGGPASARNTGAAMARGPVILFLDSDCVAPPGWVDAVLARFEDPAVTAVLCPLEAAEAGNVPAIVQAEIEERYDRLRSAAGDIDFLASAAFGIRADGFRRVGGFDERFRFNEDVDLAFRLVADGARIVFADICRVRHLHQRTWRDLLRTKFWRGVWRMRLYRLFPDKRVSDSWTPGSLKLQILSALAVPPAVLAGFAEPAGWTVAAAAVLLLAVSGSGTWSATTRTLKPTAGASAPLLAAGWVAARAAVLAWAVLYARFSHWTPPDRAVRPALGAPTPMPTD